MRRNDEPGRGGNDELENSHAVTQRMQEERTLRLAKEVTCPRDSVFEVCHAFHSVAITFHTRAKCHVSTRTVKTSEERLRGKVGT